MPPAPENVAKRLAKARRLVRKPAIALLVVGILCLVLSLFMMAGSLWGTETNLIPVALFLTLIIAVAGVVTLISGFSMMQLRCYQLCIVGSIVVMPLVLSLPIGIWALTTLRLPGMRSAFELNEKRVVDELWLAEEKG